MWWVPAFPLSQPTSNLRRRSQLFAVPQYLSASLISGQSQVTDASRPTTLCVKQGRNEQSDHGQHIFHWSQNEGGNQSATVALLMRIFPEKEADEVFEGHVDRLRKLIQKRTAVYAAEEKALRVMLEGEQEEERKRELEKRQKKEREKFLQKKRETEAMLFGEAMHPDHPLQPFRQCYTQAEHSLHALIQIRREWDSYLVPVDRPDGCSVPQSWVLPEPPSDETWASALEK